MDLANIGLSGLKQAEARLDQTAKRISRGTAPEPESSQPADSIDLATGAVHATEAVQMIEAVNSYTANLKLIQTANEIERHTINLLG